MIVFLTKKGLSDEKVLVLNASFYPLGVSSWKKGVLLVWKKKAEIIEYNGHFLREDIRLPCVIRLNRNIFLPYKEVALTRKNVIARDQNTCQYCGKKSSNLTVDHVIPKSRGGELVWENVVAACQSCNLKKGNRTPDEANMKLLRPPRKPKVPSNFLEVIRCAKNQYHEWLKYIPKKYFS